MKKLTVSLLGMALLLFAFSVPAVFAQVSCNNDADCADDSIFCNGIESCAPGASVCVSSGDPCEGLVCDETNAECVAPECTTNDDCFDFIACNGIETCVEGSCVDGEPPCGEQACNELDDGNYECLECEYDSDCPDAANPCNGEGICSEGQCETTGNPCGEQTCIPLAVAVSQPAIQQIPPTDYICVDVECDNDTQCNDGNFCNGEETCDNGTCTAPGDPCAGDNSTPVCDEIGNSCVECLVDDNCTGETPYCLDNMCVGCRDDDDDCREGDNNTPYCDGESLSCVECLVSADCENDNETCRQGVCGVAECELKIRPKKVRTSKMFRPVERRFKIKAEERYVPGEPIELDFGWLQPYVKKYEVNKKGKLKVWVVTPTGARLFKGLLEVRVNGCVGEILFK